MDLFLIIIGMFLLIFSIIDWKIKMIPSIFLTAVLFTIAILNPANLWYGIIGFIMAYLLYETDFFSGIADIKIMTMIAFLIPTTSWLLFFIGFVVVYGTIWKILIKWRIRSDTETAFVPVFFFVYLTIWMLGGLA